MSPSSVDSTRPKRSILTKSLFLYLLILDVDRLDGFPSSSILVRVRFSLLFFLLFFFSSSRRSSRPARHPGSHVEGHYHKPTKHQIPSFVSNTSLPSPTMNAAAAARASMIRTSMYRVPALTRPPPPLPNGRNIAPRRADDSSATYDDEYGYDQPQPSPRRVIQVVDYMSYKQQCEREREQVPPAAGMYQGSNGSADSLDKPPAKFYVEIEEGGRGRIARMFTVFPVRDINWIVTVMFIFGSASFVTSATFGLIPVVAPSLAFPEISTLAVPGFLATGSLTFTIAGVLGMIGAFNANRGTVEVQKGGVATYRPALIGSESWVWKPTSEELAVLFKTIPFPASLVSWASGLFFLVATFSGLPGNVPPTSPAFKFLVPMQQVIGGVLLFLANVSVIFVIQERWYKPKLTPDWLGTFLNIVGSTGFTLIGALNLAGAPGSGFTYWYGAMAFLIGSTIGLYGLMEFHPTAWAA
ncbi:hypothetical protein MAPG_02028 [Magnaporthiopsis poae ATCC 64411]|uniref:Integral membrane protein n=1 Tax=Magnaporthiopsis poae (strain ATCC 64411 / 73-15) TaxID=644358 RepID=A0A0C4DQ90_MAGP6|nr:hypothetical protein MAPG_02028 [Magnaporthiopsis poae ATCC 64411]